MLFPNHRFPYDARRLRDASGPEGKIWLGHCLQCRAFHLREGLSWEILSRFDAELAAIHLSRRLDDLPQVLCRPCHELAIGGLVEADEFHLVLPERDCFGYGWTFVGEQMHTVCYAHPIDVMGRALPPATLCVNQGLMLAMQRWLAGLSVPERVHVILTTALADFGGEEPLPSDRYWAGCFWVTSDSPLGESTMVLVTQVLPIEEEINPSTVWEHWRGLFRRLMAQP